MLAVKGPEGLRAAFADADPARVEVRIGTTIQQAANDGVLLSGGEFVPTRSVIWCVGARPDPLIDDPGQLTAMTAQHPWCLPRLRRDRITHAELAGPGDGLGAVGRAELGEEMADVLF